jgi:hypothetical protein
MTIPDLSSSAPEVTVRASQEEEFSAEFDRRVVQPSVAPVPPSSTLHVNVNVNLASTGDGEVEDDAMFRPPSNPVPIPTVFGERDEAHNQASKAPALHDETPLQQPVPVAATIPFGSAGHEQRIGAVRAALPLEQRSPSEEEATVLGQRRVVAPVPPVANKRPIPLAWIALIVTALIGGLMIAFYPGKKSPKPIAVGQPSSETKLGDQAGGATTILRANTSPPVDPLPRVSESSPQKLAVTEKLEESGEFSLAELRWTDGTPPLVAAYVAASKQGETPRAVPIEDAASKRAVIVGIDPKAAYCFWVVAFDTSVRPIVQYRSEQQCVRGGVPYNFQ